MAQIKIAQLTNQTTIADTDTVIVETATSTNKMTVGNLKTLLGIAEGGVVESGSNSFGEYTRFSNGLQICTRVLPQGTEITPAVAVNNFNYPAEFISFPSVSYSAIGNVLNPDHYDMYDNLYISARNNIEWNFRSKATMILPTSIVVHAIGPWK